MLKLELLDGSGKSLWLVGSGLRIGAHSHNRLCLEGQGIADFHAEIVIEGERLLLRSAAGSCFINDLPVDAEYLLKAGDELRIGTQRMRISDPKRQLAAELAASVAPARWSLHVDHPQLRHKAIEVSAALQLGSGASCDVVIPYKMLSPRHVQLVPQPEGLLVRDLGSEHGTFVNGRRITEAVVVAGDKVHFARLPFSVVSAA